MNAGLFSQVPQPDIAQPFTMPAPIAGIDANTLLYNMSTLSAVYLYNLLPAAYGLRTREGYLVWAQNLAGSAVNSIIPFKGTLSGQQRLFAATPTGFFDVSTQGTDNPTAAVTFGNQAATAGFCTYHHVTDPGGGQTIYIADSENGLYEYDPTGPTWTKLTTQITGVDPTKVVFVMGHKGRLWFIERDSADAWYLPTGAKVGAAVKFQFGSKMRHGGFLVGLYTYTLDGGAGLDDYLVAISKAGDVMVYQGTDPAVSTSWNLVGNWYIGAMPEGRRVAIESGGDLLILSSFGVISMASLLRGIDPSIIERNISGKIAPLVQRDLKVKGTRPYWEVKRLAEEGAFVINTPVQTGERHIQYALDINRTTEGAGGGWGMWRDVPATTLEPYEGNAFFGTTDGRVCRMSGELDNVDINGQNGVQFEFSLLSAYSDAGLPGRYKQVQLIRPTFIADNQIVYAAQALYDFSLEEITLQGLPGVGAASDGAWDVSNWDAALWVGQRSTWNTIGSNGYGRNFAIAVRGNNVARATLINIEGTVEPWGFL